MTVKINPLVNSELNILSIQVSLDGFSFYIHSDNSNEPIHAEHFAYKNVTTAEQALIEIQQLFENSAILHNSFSNVAVVYANELYTIVPKQLFDPKNLTDYLKFNTKILKTDFIVYDELESLDLINIYVPYTNINNFFFDHFGTFTYYHSQSILIKNILEDSTVTAEPQGKSLLLSNHFKYTTDADFVYCILFCLEQLALNPEEIKVSFKGFIDTEDSKYQLIYTYVRNVEIVETVEENQLNYAYLKYNLNL